MHGKHTVVVFDKDSTLADTRHRWKLSPMADPSSSWDAYSLACDGDAPLPGPLALMRLLWREHQVHVCTGAGAVSRPEVIRWLDKHAWASWDILRMRASDDHQTNGALKVAYVRELQAQGLQVVLFVEDWADAARQIHEETGVPVLGVTAFYPEDLAALQAGRKDAGDGIGGGL